MRVFAGVGELAAAQGHHLGHSDWHEITQDRIDAFAAATGDNQWIHVDPQAAAAGPFGVTIAHGFLTVSLIPMLAREVYRVDNLQLAINYGCDSVRFPAPVPVGSRVRAGVQLLAVTAGDSDPSRHRVTTRAVVESDRSDKPACVAELVAVLIGKEEL